MNGANECIFIICYLSETMIKNKMCFVNVWDCDDIITMVIQKSENTKLK